MNHFNEHDFMEFYFKLSNEAFKYFVKNDTVLVYKNDFKFLPADYSSNSSFVKVQNIEQIVKDCLTVKKIPVNEYSYVDGEYKLTRWGSGVDYNHFMDICLEDTMPPCVISVVFKDAISVSFIQDGVIKTTSFYDDDLLSNLYSLVCSLNCLLVIHNDKSKERNFINWDIKTYLLTGTCCVDMLQRYMKVVLEVSHFDYKRVCNIDIRYFDVSVDDFNLVTNQGKRLLSQWIRSPSTDVAELEMRLDLVELFSDIEIDLKGVIDLKRSILKIFNKKILITEITKIVKSVENIPQIILILNKKKESILYEQFIRPLKQVYEIFSIAIKELRNILDFENDRVLIDGNHLLISYENEKVSIFDEIEKEFLRVKEKCPKLKFKDRMFKISRMDYNKDDFDSRGFLLISLLKTGVNFTTKNLAEANEKLLEVERKIKIEEFIVLDKIRHVLMEYINSLEAFNHLIAQMDIYKGFSYKIRSGVYCRPIFGSKFHLIDLFHPFLEHKGVINNSIEFSRDLCILTGPNMGGKSTFLKSLSVVSLYAQIGCYVPCSKAFLPIFDKIFLRIGATDFSANCQSTFMVEMLELSRILRSATRDSLVLIDELGRGTSAVDGLGIILATKEHLLEVGCKAVMSTHFSQVGDDSTLNKKMSVSKNVLTYKIEDGKCDTSFGIKVAEMASFPGEVLSEAKRYLNE